MDNAMNCIDLIRKQEEYVDWRLSNFPDDPFVVKLKPVREKLNALRQDLSKLEDEEVVLAEELVDDALKNGTDERALEMRRVALLCPDSDDDDDASITSDDLKPLESDSDE
jgi:hypothetical protein